MNTTNTTRKTYESLSEAAARTGMSIKTLRRRIAHGELTAFRSGRIIRLDPNDVDRLLARIPTFPTRWRGDLMQGDRVSLEHVIHMMVPDSMVFHRCKFAEPEAYSRDTVDVDRNSAAGTGSTGEALMTGRWVAAPRRACAGVMVGCLLSLLSACNKSDGPEPTVASASSTTVSVRPPAPSPTQASSEIPQERDARLAGEVVVKYWAAVDDLAAHPGANINRLDALARGQARAQMQTLLGTYATKGLVQKGTSSLSQVKASTKDAKSFTVTACVDVSAVDLVDRTGASKVNPDRPDQQQYSYTVVKAPEGFFVTKDTLKGEPC